MNELLKEATDKLERYQIESYKFSMRVLGTFLIAACTVLVVSQTVLGALQFEDAKLYKFYNLTFRLTNALNTLCILLLGVSLYTYALRLNMLVGDIRKVCVKLSHPQNTSDAIFGEVVNTSIPTWFLVIEKAAYISFGIFIICLFTQGLFKQALLQ